MGQPVTRWGDKPPPPRGTAGRTVAPLLARVIRRARIKRQEPDPARKITLSFFSFFRLGKAEDKVLSRMGQSALCQCVGRRPSTYTRLHESLRGPRTPRVGTGLRSLNKLKSRPRTYPPDLEFIALFVQKSNGRFGWRRELHIAAVHGMS